MKNKGFTLVGLLAVIVVLAIISIITIPMIGNVIDESKKKALEVSANGLVEAASYYTINHDGVYEFVFDENKKGETIKGEQLDYKGSIEETGKLYIDQEGDTSLCLVDDKYYVYKNYNSGIYVGEVKDNTCTIGYNVLTNKYVAMLDDGTGQVSNVYSKEEVNNLIDSLQDQINTIDRNLESLSSVVNGIQNNSATSIRYDEETDYIQTFYNGNWVNYKYIGNKIPYLYLPGDEKEFVTGGWITDGYTIHPVIPIGGNVKKLSDSILLTVDTTTDRIGIIVGTSSPLSLSNYSTVTVAYNWGGIEYTLTLDISDISSGYLSFVIDNYCYASSHDIRFGITVSSSKEYIHDVGRYKLHTQNYSDNLRTLNILKVYLTP